MKHMALRFYRDRSGNEPFKEWLLGLKDLKAASIINNHVRRLSIGHKGDFKKIDKRIYELRIHFGPGYRVYFAEQGNELVILLLGGDKKSQKRDIKQAKLCWSDYLEQYDGKN